MEGQTILLLAGIYGTVSMLVNLVSVCHPAVYQEIAY